MSPNKIAAQIFADLIHSMFDVPIMGNLYRPDYVERMVALGLGEDFELTSSDWAGWDIEHKLNSRDWPAWDIEHTPEFRIEVKQSAAFQTWTDRSPDGKPGKGSFDIAPRTGYFPRSGGPFVEKAGRLSHVYILAWHPIEKRAEVDQRDPDQWRFFIIPATELPANQKSISRTVVEARWTAVGFERLRESMLDAMSKILVG